MRLLLDTHLLVWWFAGVKLPPKARDLIRDPANQVFASAASIWELAIKSALGRIDVDADELVVALLTGGFAELPITTRHAAAVARLPEHHRDPFDRLLVAQCLVEPMHLLTHDRVLAKYGSSIVIAE